VEIRLKAHRGWPAICSLAQASNQAPPENRSASLVDLGRSAYQHNRLVPADIFLPILQVIEWSKRALHCFRAFLRSFRLFLPRLDFRFPFHPVPQRRRNDRDLEVAKTKGIVLSFELLTKQCILDCIDRKESSRFNGKQSRRWLRNHCHLRAGIRQELYSFLHANDTGDTPSLRALFPKRGYSDHLS